jgi:hypothetical protein
VARGNFISVRTEPDTQAKLRAAAERRGVSINQEINDRLTASFDDDRDPDKVFASRALFGLMKLVAEAMQLTGGLALYADTGSTEHRLEFFKNPYAFEQALHAAIIVLEHCRPPGHPEPSQRSAEADMAEFKLRVGVVGARDLLNIVIGPADDASSRGERLRRGLDPSIFENIKRRREAGV